MTGFLCSTPYHLLLCLIMALNNYSSEDKAIIIMNRFKDAKRIADILRKTHIFKYVLIMETHDFDKLTNWNRRFRMFFFYPQIKEILGNVSFDNFVFFAPDLLEVSFIIKLIYKCNINCNFFFAEDGMGAYIDETIYKPNRRMRNWLILLRRLKYLKLIRGIYLIHPELCTAKYSYKKLKIENKAVNKDSFLNLVREIWGCESIESCNVLLLHQPFELDGKPEVQTQQDQCFREIIKSVDNCSIKFHPRDKKRHDFKNCKIVNSLGMFEILLLNGFKPDALCGVNSTALLTPFMLWNQTPKLFFLYKICHSPLMSKKMDCFMSNFQKVYAAAGGKLYVPASYEELMRMLLAGNGLK